ncbi:hypothetical protein GCM10010038_14490 [Glutamicibacter protophormiae]|nr:hypothetical protein GCM10010038_14490 [Glutamicibacter protophormiae]
MRCSRARQAAFELLQVTGLHRGERSAGVKQHPGDNAGGHRPADPLAEAQSAGLVQEEEQVSF